MTPYPEWFGSGEGDGEPLNIHPRISWREKLRHWLLARIAGNRPVMINIEVRLKEGPPVLYVNCQQGYFDSCRFNFSYIQVGMEFRHSALRGKDMKIKPRSNPGAGGLLVPLVLTLLAVVAWVALIRWSA